MPRHVAYTAAAVSLPPTATNLVTLYTTIPIRDARLRNSVESSATRHSIWHTNSIGLHCISLKAEPFVISSHIFAFTTIYELHAIFQTYIGDVACREYGITFVTR